MKKLLSILAAIGLAATTGTAVVACGTNDNDNKPKVKDIKGAKEKMETVTAGMDKATVQKMIVDAIKKVEGVDQKVTIADVDAEIKDVVAENDKITVTAKDESAYITGSFDFTVVKAPVVKVDIKGADKKMQPVTAGMTKTKVEELILEAVKKVEGVDQKVSAKDYDVTDIKATVVEGDEITVTAKDESAYITGSFDFTVVKANEDDQKIVDAINSTLFTKSVSVNRSAEEVKIGVGAKFIKDRLTEEFSNLFTDNLFSLHTIMNDQGTELSDSDLKVVGPIRTIINYEYDSFKNESTNLLITIKKIETTPARNEKLKILAEELNRDEFSSTINWRSYFYAIENDIEANLFTFEFSEGSLREDRIAQNIIYDEIQLILRTDFKANNIDIAKGYFNPNTVKVKYRQFQIYEKGKKITVTSELTIDVKNDADKKYHSIKVLFDYTFNYSLVK